MLDGSWLGPELRVLCLLYGNWLSSCVTPGCACCAARSHPSTLMLSVPALPAAPHADTLCLLANFVLKVGSRWLLCLLGHGVAPPSSLAVWPQACIWPTSPATSLFIALNHAGLGGAGGGV